MGCSLTEHAKRLCDTYCDIYRTRESIIRLCQDGDIGVDVASRALISLRHVLEDLAGEIASV